jgi:hypothetical protein
MYYIDESILQSDSSLEPSLRLRKTQLCYFSLIGVRLCHVFVVFLLKCLHLLEFDCLGREIFLHEFLSELVVDLLLLVVQFVEIDLHIKIFTFFYTSLLFLSARIRISPYLTDCFLYSSISFVFWRSKI